MQVTVFTRVRFVTFGVAAKPNQLEVVLVARTLSCKT